MNNEEQRKLYQQVIIEHNQNPRNFKKLDTYTNTLDGYNPLCGDHLRVYLDIDQDQVIQDISFDGDGCAVSVASASLMTQSVKGKPVDEAMKLFDQYHDLITGKLDPTRQPHNLGKLSIFAGISHYPSRVKCASLCWQAMKGAIDQKNIVCTE